MGWRDLLQAADETIVLPWVGGKTLRSKDRTFRLKVRPPEHGWHTFTLNGREASWKAPADADQSLLRYKVRGYLVGDRLVPDGASVDPDPTRIHAFAERVHFLEPGLDRFVRVLAGRVYEDGPLVYESLDMPLGPEDEVLQAFLDQKDSVSLVKGVAPALDAAFRMEVWHRVQTEQRRAELERVRREEEERRQREERRRQLVEQLGDSAGRRQMARVDFGEAAKAALTVGGAVYLDHHDGYNRGEKVVRFRLDGRRFECVCDENLRIIDSGICLTAEYGDDDFERGTRGDTFFTLESLPGVIAEADRLNRLVVFRRA